MTKLEEKLSKLREQWKSNPERRAFIERQALCIKRAIQWYSSPKYLNNKPLMREIEIAESKESQIPSDEELNKLFGVK